MGIEEDAKWPRRDSNVRQIESLSVGQGNQDLMGLSMSPIERRTSSTLLDGIGQNTGDVAQHHTLSGGRLLDEEENRRDLHWTQ